MKIKLNQFASFIARSTNENEGNDQETIQLPNTSRPRK